LMVVDYIKEKHIATLTQPLFSIIVLARSIQGDAKNDRNEFPSRVSSC